MHRKMHKYAEQSIKTIIIIIIIVCVLLWAVCYNLQKCQN